MSKANGTVFLSDVMEKLNKINIPAVLLTFVHNQVWCVYWSLIQSIDKYMYTRKMKTKIGHMRYW